MLSLGQMKVLMTGAGGMLGRDVAAAADRAGHEVTALARTALDVTDAQAVAAAMARERPALVVNCAAWTDVDGAEDDEAGATAINGEAAGVVAGAAAAVGARVIYPSTDYVFDGAGSSPYVESDPTRPLSAYGRSKLAGEHATAAANDSHFIARTSWLFGNGGANFVETMLSLGAERGEVTVVHDQVGSPTYTRHLAEALLALARGDSFGVHHLTADGHCSWHDFAIAIFREADIDCRVEPCATSEMPRPAPRPAYSVLAPGRPETPALPHWREGLAGYLAERAVPLVR